MINKMLEQIQNKESLRKAEDKQKFVAEILVKISEPVQQLIRRMIENQEDDMQQSKLNLILSEVFEQAEDPTQKKVELEKEDFISKSLLQEEKIIKKYLRFDWSRINTSKIEQ